MNNHLYKLNHETKSSQNFARFKKKKKKNIKENKPKQKIITEK